MISSEAIGNRCNGCLSVAHSPAANLPQINSDNDNSVCARRLEARVRALIVDANVYECKLAGRRNRFRRENNERYSATILRSY